MLGEWVGMSVTVVSLLYFRKVGDEAYSGNSHSALARPSFSRELGGLNALISGGRKLIDTKSSLKGLDEMSVRNRLVLVYIRKFLVGVMMAWHDTYDQWKREKLT